MKAFCIFKKEAKIAFASPMAYALFFVFLFICGWIFKTIVGFVVVSAITPFSVNNLSVMETVFRPLYRNMAVVLLFLLPAISMNLFAEEKRSGTLELLFTYPLSDLDILLGKFFSALFMLAFILLPTLLYAVFINHFSPVSWKVLFVQYLGFFLFGSACLSFGIWVSSWTEKIHVAYFYTFVGLLFFWIVGWSSESGSTSTASQIMGQLSLLNHFDNFVKGVLSLNDLVFYLLFSIFFLYLAYKVLQSRTWQGAKT
jgi:ABC-2 type transport system permease protein